MFPRSSEYRWLPSLHSLALAFLLSRFHFFPTQGLCPNQSISWLLLLLFFFFQHLYRDDNSHTIKFTHLTCRMQLFVIYSRSCDHHHFLNWEHFRYHHKKKPLLSSHSFSLSRFTLPPALGSYFLSLQIYLFWTFYINEIIQYFFVTGFFHLTCFQGSSML